MQSKPHRAWWIGLTAATVSGCGDPVEDPLVYGNPPRLLETSSAQPAGAPAQAESTGGLVDLRAKPSASAK